MNNWNARYMVWIIAWLFFLASGFICTGTADPYRIAIVRDNQPIHDALLNPLQKLLQDKGIKTTLISVDRLAVATDALHERYDCLILPSSQRVPSTSIEAIQTFLQNGGDIIAMQAPCFADPTFQIEDRWVTETEWRDLLGGVSLEHVVIDMNEQSENSWIRHTNNPNSAAEWRIVKENTRAYLDVRVSDLTGWDTLSYPELSQPFPEGHTLTCFYARGLDDTTSLSFEWIEQDGSRWIAVFPVSDQWQRIVLAPSDFRFWESVENRGFKGDRFNPQQAVRFQVGVAWTHTGQRGGAYHYQIASIGTAKNPYGEFPSMADPSIVMEGLSPTYKFYPITNVQTYSIHPAISLNLKSIAMPAEGAIFAHHPRPTGKGYNKQRSWRWIPLLSFYGPDADWRGAPISLMLNVDHPYSRSVRAACSIHDESWYRQAEVHQLFAALIERMSHKLYLLEAGSEYFTYRPRESVTIGAKIANLGAASSNTAKECELWCRLYDADKRHKYQEFRLPLSVAPSEILDVTRRFYLPADHDQFVILYQLVYRKSVIDEIEHEIGVWDTKPARDRKFIKVKDGDFMLDGEKWYIHGINYMPSTGIAIEDQSYFEYWMGGRSYDPEFVQRDLERIRAMGLNLVSVFIYHRSSADNNLIDFLRRCEDLGLKVNLSIRPGTPMNYNWEWWKEIIVSNRLHEIDTIFAYDIAWEPFFGTTDERRAYDAEWIAWIIKKHGSIANAESKWNFPIPKQEGKPTSPDADLLGRNGPHRGMIADYRTFVDQLIHEKYLAAKQKILQVDPNHLISFRMTVSGDPTFKGDVRMPYDFKAVADCMDFFAPEGYGRIGGWEQIKPGLFTVAYARYCAPKKPVVWAEAGVHAWNNQTMQTDPDLLEIQREFYKNFYEMVLQSYSNGVVWWWYPGGYRANERSDYGIIHPDGTDRPCTQMIRQYAERVLADKRVPAPNVFIPIDRDADARGLFGIYETVKDRFWAAIESGRFPSLQ